MGKNNQLSYKTGPIRNSHFKSVQVIQGIVINKQKRLVTIVLLLIFTETKKCLNQMFYFLFM